MSDRSSNKDEASAERSPWSRPSVLLSGAFLLALVLLGVVVAVIGGGSDGGQPARAPVTARRPAARPPQGTASGCAERPAGSQAIPASSPPPARWGTVGSMQVPQSPTVYGPERSNGPWETCFAHSPSGALLAAMNFYAEGTAASPSAVLEHLAVNVTAADRTGGGLDANGPVQLAGYRYDSYTPSEAQLTIVLQGPQGKLAGVVSVMRWNGSDWRYLAPADGTPSAEVLRDLTGYVPWSAF
ncbi:MAG: hypothetical protein ACYC91_05730 [Solirubrobacteraceae bacterium]